MKGAEALVETLIAGGIEICFANPGTSEMEFVAALDNRSDIRAILCLFEGVATGAADGYARMAGKPAATLLHLGSGLGNGLANLHNARRARSPVVNIVGDHATYHLQYDAPLTSDIGAIARSVSQHVQQPQDLATFISDAADVVHAASSYPGQVATLIAHADLAWAEGTKPANISPPRPAREPQAAHIDLAADALKSGEACAILLGGKALIGEALEAAGRIAAASGASLFCETFPARIERGGSRPTVERLPYFAEDAIHTLSAFRHLIIAGAQEPVAFFAYPGKPSRLTPDSTDQIHLATPYEDVGKAFKLLVERLPDPASIPFDFKPKEIIQLPQDAPLNPVNLAATVAALLPENSIVSDDSTTGSLALFPATMRSRPHDWLALTGGAIGQGLPLAVGASVACPDRKVVCLQADGSGMYTLQALWTMAREELNVTTVILNNSSYAILNIELARLGTKSIGTEARSLLDLSNPSINWVSLSQGMGVPAQRVQTVNELQIALTRAIDSRGPSLVEAILPSL